MTRAAFHDHAAEYARWPHHEPKPSLDETADQCPYCQQSLAENSDIASVFASGFKRLQLAVWMIGIAVFRCIRFGIAAVLCLVGVLGACCRLLATKIAHPHDQRFLPLK